MIWQKAVFEILCFSYLHDLHDFSAILRSLIDLLQRCSNQYGQHGHYQVKKKYVTKVAASEGGLVRA